MYYLTSSSPLYCMTLSFRIASSLETQDIVSYQVRVVGLHCSSTNKRGGVCPFENQPQPEFRVAHQGESGSDAQTNPYKLPNVW